MVECGVQLVDRSRPERVAHLRPIEGDAHRAVVDSTVVGDVVEVKPGTSRQAAGSNNSETMDHIVLYRALLRSPRDRPADLRRPRHPRDRRGHGSGGDHRRRGLRPQVPIVVDGDIVVVTSKIVSKAEGRTVELADVEPSPFAIEWSAAWDKDPAVTEVVLREAKRIVRQVGPVLITETHHGFVCANSGVDQSSSGAHGRLVVLPVDPDASARRIRAGFATAGVDVAVIISDTFGRAWREGQTDIAIGIAGMQPIHSYIGQFDPHGHEFRVQAVCLADELAGAAELVKGNISRMPVGVIRGYAWEADDCGDHRPRAARPEPGSVQIGSMAEQIRVERTIRAEAAELYDLVSDLPRMGEWSPENTGGAWVNGAEGPVVGARFKGSNRKGWARWSTDVVVTVAEPGERFSFDVTRGPVRIANWDYRFEQDGGKTWSSRRGPTIVRRWSAR